jgi:hypothetical protein
MILESNVFHCHVKEFTLQLFSFNIWNNRTDINKKVKLNEFLSIQLTL